MNHKVLVISFFYIFMTMSIKSNKLAYQLNLYIMGKDDTFCNFSKTTLPRLSLQKNYKIELNSGLLYLKKTY